MDSVFVAMDLTRLPFRSDEPATILCTKCYTTLDRHQLDTELPSRMIGTCETCKAWYLIDVDEGLMALRPDEGDLRGV